MGFKEQAAKDMKNVFLNTSEFAETRTVKVDGKTFSDIPVVLSDLRQEDRRIREDVRDHTQGLYKSCAVLRCALADLGETQPEKGQRLQINTKECLYKPESTANLSQNNHLVF